MSDQKRQTKTLASRIQLDYLFRKRPLIHWKNVLMLVAFIAAVVWFSGDYFFRFHRAVSPGPISKAHSSFEKTCTTCHVSSFDVVPDKACVACHSERLHNKNQESPPRCATCHVEHTGIHLGIDIGDKPCATCHADLKRKDGQKPDESRLHITSFEKDHPEWKYLRTDWVISQAPAIKLNHAVHMKPGLAGEGGKKVNMKCGDCHLVDLEKDPQGIYRKSAFDHQKQCLDCHGLTFDGRYPGSTAPHKKPEEVEKFIFQFYAEKMQARDGGVVPDRQFVGPQAAPAVSFGSGWVEAQSEAALTHLLEKKCSLCHDLSKAAGLPEVPKVQMPSKYLDEGTFNHASHRGMVCMDCHTQALTSKKSEDVLIPGINSCLPCHGSGGNPGPHCQICHPYHSKEAEKVDVERPQEKS